MVHDCAWWLGGRKVPQKFLAKQQSTCCSLWRLILYPFTLPIYLKYFSPETSRNFSINSSESRTAM